MRGVMMGGLAALLTGASLAAQEPGHSHGGHLDGLGSVHFPNSGAAAAQEPFLRGIALLHSFEYEDAEDAFREAQRLDPSFALAYWAQALTSAKLLWGREDAAAARAALARLAPTREARLARAGTPRERAYGAAVEALFAEADLRNRTRGYADSLRSLARREPDDLEAAAFASIALQMAAVTGGFAGEERRTARADAIELAERVFRTNRDHPGAAHYLIHAFDDPAVASRGLEMARAYAQIAPDAQHALHMPSHIFLQVGLWDDVVASNERAWAASREWARRRGAGPLDLDYHSLEWLHYGYLQQGRHRAARALVDTVRALLAGAALAGSVDPTFVEQRLTFRQAAESGRWQGTVASAPPRAAAPGAESRYAYFRLVSMYQAAAAALLAGDTTSPAVAEFAAEVEEVGPPALRSEYHTLLPLHLAALGARSRGDFAAAIATLTAAAAVDDRISPSGPPTALPTLELLGTVLLDADRPAEAVVAFEKALDRWPNRAASLLGLARARRAAGDHAAAAEAYRRLLASWRQADADLPELAEATEGAR